jgi:hypothetical protein
MKRQNKTNLPRTLIDDVVAQGQRVLLPSLQYYETVINFHDCLARSPTLEDASRRFQHNFIGEEKHEVYFTLLVSQAYGKD